MTESTTGRCVASVGLGAMGRPIARHIAEAGFDVLTYDPDPATAVPGARAVSSPADLKPAEVVIVIVPTDDDVQGVVAGPGGLLENAAPGTVIVLSASLRPDTCQELARRGAEVGVHVIDAALTGGVRGAEDGEINLLVGGEQEIVDSVADVFGAFATGWHVLGSVGAGQIGKSANNLIHWAQIVAIDESLRLAEKFGVSAPALRVALEAGPTDSRTLREIEQMRFTWYVKDIEIAQDLARGVGMPLPQATLSRELMDGITVDSVHTLLGLR
jgi:3-hydroxyisobutyrate dehydrogenase-like beta-hydroxyacid dehydrogenase